MEVECASVNAEGSPLTSVCSSTKGRQRTFHFGGRVNGEDQKWNASSRVRERGSDERVI